jgi:hypothetical protein
VALKSGQGPFHLAFENDVRRAPAAREIERIEVLNLSTTGPSHQGH